jgi:hypothetical protein
MGAWDAHAASTCQVVSAAGATMQHSSTLENSYSRCHYSARHLLVSPCSSTR